jgi:hypothetical protein
VAEQEPFKFKIPPAVTKYLKPDAPKDARLMAAKGLIPMPPPILASALTFFLNDADPDIQKAAHEGLTSMPPSLVGKIVTEEVHPKTLDFFAHLHSAKGDLVEKILLNKLTTDDTFIFLAESVSEALATMIANNQVRLLRTPSIAEALRKNKNALRSEIERMVSFLRINGIILEGETPELTADEIRDILNADEPEVPEMRLPEILTREFGKDEELTEEKKLTMYQMVQQMNVASKVKLALKGNKEARSLLIKDANKIVATSVVKSPKITDGEVIAIAQSRTSHDEVIRIISMNPEWTKNYNLQVALTNNPKTPFPIAMKYLRMMHVGDLQKMAKNKNVSGQLSKIAKEMYETKRK